MKRRRQAADPSVIEPTPEQLARGEWETVEAARDEGWQGKQKYTKRRKSPLLDWYRRQWINEEQLKALAEYDQLLSRANYGRVKSCLNIMQGGRGNGHATPLDSPQPVLVARAEIRVLHARLYRMAVDKRWGSVLPLNWLVDELTATDPVQVRAEKKRAWLPVLANELHDYFRGTKKGA